MGFGMGLLAMTGQTARRIGELGFIIGAIGGLLFIAGAALLANDAEETRTPRNVLMGAGVCYNHRLHLRHHFVALDPLTPVPPGSR